MMSKAELSRILPLNNQEIEFVQCIRSTGKIRPELLTQDKKLASIIASHPALHWAAQKSSIPDKGI